MTSRTALSRRTALAAAAVVPVALGGCDIDPPSDEDPAGGVVPTPHADSTLVDEVAAAIAGAEAVVAAALASAPTRTRPLERLASAHAAHRELLAEATSGAAPPAVEGGAPAGRVAALAAVRRVERRLGATLERASLQASSGDLARVLAVMAASLAQHTAGLEASRDAGTAP